MKKKRHPKHNTQGMIRAELPSVCCVISPEQNDRLTATRRKLERFLGFIKARGDGDFIGVHAPDLEYILRTAIYAIPTLQDHDNQVGILVISDRPAAETRH